MKTVMIVDDSTIIRRKLKIILAQLGYEMVAEAKTGKEAVDFYKEFSPTLVTMDITMPDMDGTEAVKLIIQDNPEANIIMSTSHKDPRMVMDALMYGAKGYIVKPTTKDELEERINEIFGTFSEDEDELLDD